MRKLAAAVVITTALACTPRPPSLVPQQRPPVPVQASRAATFAAALDVFAREAIPIQSQDPTSGTIVTAPMAVAGERAAAEARYADCGRGADGSQIAPETAEFRVTVAGDESRATISSLVRWGGLSSSFNRWQCVSRGIWEQRVDSVIAIRASSTQDPRVLPRLNLTAVTAVTDERGLVWRVTERDPSFSQKAALRFESVTGEVRESSPLDINWRRRTEAELLAMLVSATVVARHQ